MAPDLADGTPMQQSYILLIRMLPGTTCLTYDGYATKRDVRHFLSLLLCPILPVVRNFDLPQRHQIPCPFRSA